MQRKEKLILRVISIVLIGAFLVQEVSYAAPGQTFAPAPMQSPIQRLLEDPTRFEAPLDFSILQEVHAGTNGKLIIHIQDAHTNLSGQQNLAASLDALMTRYKISLVLSEGGEKDCSLTPYKAAATPAIWKKVAKKYLFQGKLAGEEYLNLTSDHPMKIMGIEDGELYWKSVTSYADLADKREKTLAYLKDIRSVLEKLKRKAYPQELFKYDQAARADEKALEKHFKSLMSLASAKNVSLEDFPNLMKLRRLQEKEATIDFNAANLEQAALVEEITRKGGREDLDKFLKKAKQIKGNKVSQYAYFQNIFELAKEKKIDLSVYPTLLVFGDYLKDFSKIDLDEVLSEAETAEDRVYVSWLSEEDARLIRAIDRYVELLFKAYRIQMSTKDFLLFEANEPDFTTVAYLGFMNRKLAELGYFQDLVPYIEVLEEGKKALVDFYDSVDKRDMAFLEKTEMYLQSEDQKVAFLITGGYHTPHIKKLFLDKGYSFAVLTPIVTSETNQKKYESLLLDSVRPKTQTVQTVSGESKRRQESPLSDIEKSILAAKNDDGVKTPSAVRPPTRLGTRIQPARIVEIAAEAASTANAGVPMMAKGMVTAAATPADETKAGSRARTADTGEGKPGNRIAGSRAGKANLVGDFKRFNVQDFVPNLIEAIFQMLPTGVLRWAGRILAVGGAIAIGAVYILQLSNPLNWVLVGLIVINVGLALISTARTGRGETGRIGTGMRGLPLDPQRMAERVFTVVWEWTLAWVPAKTRAWLGVALTIGGFAAMGAAIVISFLSVQAIVAIAWSLVGFFVLQIGSALISSALIRQADGSPSAGYVADRVAGWTLRFVGYVLQGIGIITMAAVLIAQVAGPQSLFILIALKAYSVPVLIALIFVFLKSASLSRDGNRLIEQSKIDAKSAKDAQPARARTDRSAVSTAAAQRTGADLIRSGMWAVSLAIPSAAAAIFGLFNLFGVYAIATQWLVSIGVVLGTAQLIATAFFALLVIVAIVFFVRAVLKFAQAPKSALAGGSSLRTLGLATAIVFSWVGLAVAVILSIITPGFFLSGAFIFFAVISLAGNLAVEWLAGGVTSKLISPLRVFVDFTVFLLGEIREALNLVIVDILNPGQREIRAAGKFAERLMSFIPNRVTLANRGLILRSMGQFIIFVAMVGLVGAILLPFIIPLGAWASLNVVAGLIFLVLLTRIGAPLEQAGKKLIAESKTVGSRVRTGTQFLVATASLISSLVFAASAAAILISAGLTGAWVVSSVTIAGILLVVAGISYRVMQKNWRGDKLLLLEHVGIIAISLISFGALWYVGMGVFLIVQVAWSALLVVLPLMALGSFISLLMNREPSGEGKPGNVRTGGSRVRTWLANAAAWIDRAFGEMSDLRAIAEFFDYAKGLVKSMPWNAKVLTGAALLIITTMMVGAYGWLAVPAILAFVVTSFFFNALLTPDKDLKTDSSVPTGSRVAPLVLFAAFIFVWVIAPVVPQLVVLLPAQAAWMAGLLPAALMQWLGLASASGIALSLVLGVLAFLTTQNSISSILFRPIIWFGPLAVLIVAGATSVMAALLAVYLLLVAQASWWLVAAGFIAIVLLGYHVVGTATSTFSDGRESLSLPYFSPGQSEAVAYYFVLLPAIVGALYFSVAAFWALALVLLVHKFSLDGIKAVMKAARAEESRHGSRVVSVSWKKIWESWLSWTINLDVDGQQVSITYSSPSLIEITINQWLSNFPENSAAKTQGLRFHYDGKEWSLTNEASRGQVEHSGKLTKSGKAKDMDALVRTLLLISQPAGSRAGWTLRDWAYGITPYRPEEDRAALKKIFPSWFFGPDYADKAIDNLNQLDRIKEGRVSRRAVFAFVRANFSPGAVLLAFSPAFIGIVLSIGLTGYIFVATTFAWMAILPAIVAVSLLVLVVQYFRAVRAGNEPRFGFGRRGALLSAALLFSISVGAVLVGISSFWIVVGALLLSAVAAIYVVNGENVSNVDTRLWRVEHVTILAFLYLAITGFLSGIWAPALIIVGVSMIVTFFLEKFDSRVGHYGLEKWTKAAHDSRSLGFDLEYYLEHERRRPVNRFVAGAITALSLTTLPLFLKAFTGAALLSVLSQAAVAAVIIGAAAIAAIVLTYVMMWIIDDFSLVEDRYMTVVAVSLASMFFVGSALIIGSFVAHASLAAVLVGVAGVLLAIFTNITRRSLRMEEWVVGITGALSLAGVAWLAWGALTGIPLILMLSLSAIAIISVGMAVLADAPEREYEEERRKTEQAEMEAIFGKPAGSRTWNLIVAFTILAVHLVSTTLPVLFMISTLITYSVLPLISLSAQAYMIGFLMSVSHIAIFAALTSIVTTIVQASLLRGHMNSLDRRLTATNLGLIVVIGGMRLLGIGSRVGTIKVGKRILWGWVPTGGWFGDTYLILGWRRLNLDDRQKTDPGTIADFINEWIKTLPADSVAKRNNVRVSVDAPDYNWDGSADILLMEGPEGARTVRYRMGWGGISTNSFLNALRAIAATEGNKPAGSRILVILVGSPLIGAFFTGAAYLIFTLAMGIQIAAIAIFVVFTLLGAVALIFSVSPERDDDAGSSEPPATGKVLPFNRLGSRVGKPQIHVRPQVREEVDESVSALMKQVEDGSAEATRNLGRAIPNMKNGKQKDEAIKLLMKKASARNGDAYLALAYSYPSLDAKQKKDFLAILMKQAEVGDGSALLALATLYPLLRAPSERQAVYGLIVKFSEQGTGEDRRKAIRARGLVFRHLAPAEQESTYSFLMGLAEAPETAFVHRNEALRGLGEINQHIRDKAKHSAIAEILIRFAGQRGENKYDGAFYGLGVSFEKMTSWQKARALAVLRPHFEQGSHEAVQAVARAYPHIRGAKFLLLLRGQGWGWTSLDNLYKTILAHAEAGKANAFDALAALMPYVGPARQQDILNFLIKSREAGVTHATRALLSILERIKELEAGEAEVNLKKKIHNPREVREDHARNVEALIERAKNGDEEALTTLAQILSFLNPETQDSVLQILEDQSKAGNAAATIALGIAFGSMGWEGRERNYSRIRDNANNQNDVAAQKALGYMFRHLTDTQKREALPLLIGKAQAGQPGAIFALGVLFNDLTDPVDRSRVLAILMAIARERSNYGKASREAAYQALGFASKSMKPEEWKAAFGIVMKATNRGNAAALGALGNFYVAENADKNKRRSIYNRLERYADDPAAIESLGYILANSPDSDSQKTKVLRLLVGLARTGKFPAVRSAALLALGYAYENLTLKQQETEVYPLIQEKLKEGEPAASVALALIFYSVETLSKKVEADAEEARQKGSQGYHELQDYFRIDIGRLLSSVVRTDLTQLYGPYLRNLTPGDLTGGLEGIDFESLLKRDGSRLMMRDGMQVAAAQLPTLGPARLVDEVAQELSAAPRAALDGADRALLKTSVLGTRTRSADTGFFNRLVVDIDIAVDNVIPAATEVRAAAVAADTDRLIVTYNNLDGFGSRIRSMEDLTANDLRLIGVAVASRGAQEEEQYPLQFKNGYALIQAKNKTVDFFVSQGEQKIQIGRLVLTDEQVAQGQADLDSLRATGAPRSQAISQADFERQLTAATSSVLVPEFAQAANTTISLVVNAPVNPNPAVMVVKVVVTGAMLDNPQVLRMVQVALPILRNKMGIVVQFGSVQGGTFVVDNTTFASVNTGEFVDPRTPESYLGTRDQVRQLNVPTGAGVNLLEAKEGSTVPILDAIIRMADIKRNGKPENVKLKISFIADRLKVKDATGGVSLLIGVPSDFNDEKKKDDYLDQLEPFTIIALDLNLDEIFGYAQMVVQAVGTSA